MFSTTTRSTVYAIVMLAGVSMASACKTQSTSTISVEQIAKNELGNSFTTDYNESKTFALCKQTRTTDHVNSIFNYCVISARENKIVHRGRYQQGSVRWADDDNIEVITTEKFSIEPTKKLIQVNKPQP